MPGAILRSSTREIVMAEYQQMRRAQTLRQAIVGAFLSLGALNVVLAAVTLSQL
jgi:hypothetical protein